MPVVQPNSVVKGTPLNINDLLSRRNIIPPYQRDYVWQKKQVEDLWNDLTAHYQRYAVHEDLHNPEGYFMGALVVIEDTENNTHEVVDGQQRLTTLSTIASVFLDTLSELDEPLPAINGLKHRLQAMLGKYDSGWDSNLSFAEPELKIFFLESCLIKRTKSEKLAYWEEPWCQIRLNRKKSSFLKIKEALLAGYDKLDAFLSGAAPELKIKRLLSFITLITEGVILLRITAMSYSSAYSIFESLNNRGIPLSQADLIKNELLRTANEIDRNLITDNWQNTRGLIDDVEILSLPDLIHYSYISRYGHIKARDLYSRVKEKIFSAAAALNYSSSLLKDAESLGALTVSFNAEWKADTMAMLVDIKNVLNIRHCYPFLMAAYRTHSNENEVFAEYVKVVMNFAYRYIKIMEESIETFITAIGEACQLINNSQPIADIKNLFLEYAPDSAFERSFKVASVSNTKLAFFTVYYLEKIQLVGALPLPHGVSQNLEHIMPKTPTAAYWPKAFLGRSNDNEEFKDYLWRLGNLLPLPASINMSLKNKSINEKISNAAGKDYTSGGHSLQSPLMIPTFLENGEWSYGSIERRQEYLATKFASKAWPL